MHRISSITLPKFQSVLFELCNEVFVWAIYIACGWFFGFKLHLLINEQGGLLAVKLTKANVDDRTPVLDMVKNIFGKL